MKDGSTFHLDKFTGKWLESTAENKQFIKEYEKKQQEYYKNKRIEARELYKGKGIPSKDIVDLDSDDEQVSKPDTTDTLGLISSTDSDMIIKTCNKHKETLLDMEDSFHNIPTKRIYTCLHYGNDKSEKYCLDLQLIMDTWENENDRYRIYSIGMAKIPIFVSDMQDIATRVNEYTKAVRE